MIEQIQKYTILIVAAIVFAAGWGSHVLYSASLTKAIEETRRIAAESTASEIAKIEISNKIIYNKTIERISTQVQYRDCKHDAETYSDIRNAFGVKK